MNKKITFTEALLTAVGMVIGSGIFFRADNILNFTESNVSIAILAWLALGFTIVFAGISLSVLATRTNREGGVIGYMEDLYGKKGAFLVGWFSTFIYAPLLTGILGIVAAIYFFDLINYSGSAMAIQVLGAVFILATFTWNYLSTKFSALFSSAATVIKLLPIVIVGTIGMTKFDTNLAFGGLSTFEMGLFAAPLLSMAFAYEGWTIVATLSRDMKNPQKEIAKVLVVSTIIITFAYVFYFTGMTMIFNSTPEGIAQILVLGDSHVGVAAQSILGDIGGKFVLFAVTVSVLGAMNGTVMGGFRYPHAMAQAGELPNSEFFVQESKYQTTGRASLLAFGATVAWYIFYTWQSLAREAQAAIVASENADLVAAAEAGTITEAQQATLTAAYKSHVFSGISFDDIPVMMMALIVMTLLVGTIKVGTKEGYGPLKSIVAPIIGLIGQGYIVYSFVITNPSWLTYMLICLAIVLVGFVIRANVVKNKS